MVRFIHILYSFGFPSFHRKVGRRDCLSFEFDTPDKNFIEFLSIGEIHAIYKLLLLHI